MRDHSMGAFWAACAAEGVMFFFVRNHISGMGRMLGMLVAGLFAYFLYYAFKKSEDRDPVWTNEDVWVSIPTAFMAMWVPVALSFVFGWGPNYYSGY